MSPDAIPTGRRVAAEIELFGKQLGYPVVQREIDRMELYVSEEIFLRGSGCDAAPALTIDGPAVGNVKVGPLTQAVREICDAAARGELPCHEAWLTTVCGKGAASGGGPLVNNATFIASAFRLSGSG